MKSTSDITLLTYNELVKKIVKSNDTHLFAVLYDRHVTMVYNKCYGFASSKEEAQDLTHDVFIKLICNISIITTYTIMYTYYVTK